jgi:hypothetical protein
VTTPFASNSHPTHHPEASVGSRPKFRRALVLVLVAASAVLLAACDLEPSQSVTNPDPTGTTLPAAPAPSVGQRTGLSTGGWFLWETNTELTKDLDAIAATGAKWVRIDFDWNSVQYDGPASFRWDRAQDRVVSQARARGLNVLGILAYSPPWARRGNCAGTKFCLPANPDAYATFAQKAAERYGSNSTVSGFRNSVTAWEIWNEPNHVPFVQPTVDVPGYTQMLKKAYTAIKAADANATVVTGGTSPAPDAANGTNVSPVSFLEGIYANGGGNSFDAVGHHPYSFPYSPLVTQSWNAFQQTQMLHDRLVAHGDGNRKIWGTEVGAPTGTDSNAVSDAQQAQIIRDAFTGWNKNFGSFTGPLFFFQHRDNGTNTGYYDENFGLLRHDWTPKPAYSAFKDEIAK